MLFYVSQNDLLLSSGMMAMSLTFLSNTVNSKSISQNDMTFSLDSDWLSSTLTTICNIAFHWTSGRLSDVQNNRNNNEMKTQVQESFDDQNKIKYDSKQLSENNGINNEIVIKGIDVHEKNGANERYQNYWIKKKIWRACVIFGYVLSIWALRRLKRKALMEGRNWLELIFNLNENVGNNYQRRKKP